MPRNIGGSISRAYVVAEPRLKHQEFWTGALADGLERHGVEVTRALAPPHHGSRWAFAVCWGWRIGKKLAKIFDNVLVLEAGYLGNRYHWTSAGWNGLNGRATFPKASDQGDRWRAYFAPLLKPWRIDDGPVLLCGQVPGDQSLEGTNHYQWLAETAARLLEDGETVLYRPHPVVRERFGDDVPNLPREIEIAPDEPIKDALAKSKYIVTFNSNSAVDAVIGGVPAVAFDRGSMAWELSGREIGDIVTPDRDAWLARMSFAQWQETEIRSGLAWEYLRDAVDI